MSNHIEKKMNFVKDLQNRLTVRLFAAAFLLLLTAAGLWAAAEPLIGTWKLASQTINGQEIKTDELTLRIFTSGNGLEFAYSIPVNGVHFVSTRFTGVHLDGTESEIQNVQGKKVGTVKISKAGPSEYKAVIEGPNRPTATARMKVSADSKTLTSESTADVPGRGATKTVQTFARF